MRIKIAVGLVTVLLSPTIAVGAAQDVTEVKVSPAKQNIARATPPPLGPKLTDAHGNEIKLRQPLRTLASYGPKLDGPIDMARLKGSGHRLDREAAILRRDKPSSIASVVGGAAAGGLLAGVLADGDPLWAAAGTIIGGLLGAADAKATDTDPRRYKRRQNWLEQEAWRRDYYFAHSDGMGHLNSPTGLIGSQYVGGENAAIYNVEDLVPGGRFPRLPNHLHPKPLHK